jgi:transposase
MPTWPGRQHRRHDGRSVLHPSKVLLLERWHAGCHTAIQLFQASRLRGYTGSAHRVTASGSRIRQAQGIPSRRQGVRQTLPVVAESASSPLTPRRAPWLGLRRAAKRTATEAQQLAQLREQHPAVAEAIDLAQDFTHLVRQRQPERLDAWLQRATSSTLEALQRFASGLREDYAAVKAGGTLPWSTSPVEGHINWRKMVKRQMLGRAHLALLRRRCLRAPRGDQAQGLGQQTPTQAPAVAA